MAGLTHLSRRGVVRDVTLGNPDDLDARYMESTQEAAAATQMQDLAEADRAADEARAAAAAPPTAESLAPEPKPAQSDVPVSEPNLNSLVSAGAGIVDAVTGAAADTVNAGSDLMLAAGGLGQGPQVEAPKVASEQRQATTSYKVANIGTDIASFVAGGRAGLKALKFLGPAAGYAGMLGGEAAVAFATADPLEGTFVNMLQEIAAEPKNAADQGFIADALGNAKRAGARGTAWALQGLAAEPDDGPLTVRLKEAAAGTVFSLAFEGVLMGAKYSGRKVLQPLARAADESVEAEVAAGEAVARTSAAADRVVELRTELNTRLAMREEVGRQLDGSIGQDAQDILASGGDLAGARAAGRGAAADVAEAAQFRAGASGEDVLESVEAMPVMGTGRDAIRAADPTLARNLDAVMAPGGTVDSAIADIERNLVAAEREFTEALKVIPRNAQKHWGQLVADVRPPMLADDLKALEANRLQTLRNSAREGAAAAATAREATAGGAAPLSAEADRALAGTTSNQVTARRLGLLRSTPEEAEALGSVVHGSIDYDNLMVNGRYSSSEASAGLTKVADHIEGMQQRLSAAEMEAIHTRGNYTLRRMAIERGGLDPAALARHIDEIVPGAASVNSKVAAMMAAEDGLKTRILKNMPVAQTGDMQSMLQLQADVELLTQMFNARRGAASTASRGVAQGIVKKLQNAQTRAQREAAMDAAARHFESLGGSEKMMATMERFKYVLDAGPQALDKYLEMSRGRLWLDMGLEAFINSVLSGVGTFSQNLVSGALNSVYFPAQRMLFGAAAGLAHGGTRGRTAAAREAFHEGLAMYAGAMRGFEVSTSLSKILLGAKRGFNEGGVKAGTHEAWDALWDSPAVKSLRSGQSQLDPHAAGAIQLESGRARAITARNVATAVGGKAGEAISNNSLLRRSLDYAGGGISTVSHILTSVDEVAKQANRHAHLESVVFRASNELGFAGPKAAEAMNTLRDAIPRWWSMTAGEADVLARQFGEESGQAMRAQLRDWDKESVEFARYATFTDELAKGMTKSIQNITQEYPVLRFFATFLRVPNRIIGFFTEGVPGLNFVLTPHARRARADWAAGGYRRQMVTQRMLAGTTLMGAAAMLYYNGKLTGAGPKNELEKQTYRNLLKKQPFSYVKSDGKHVSINRADPYGMFFTVVASILEHLDNADKNEAGSVLSELVPQMVLALSDTIRSRSSYMAVSDIIDTIGRGETVSAWERPISNLSGALIPRIVTDVTRAVTGDRTMYSNKADKSLEGFARAMSVIEQTLDGRAGNVGGNAFPVRNTVGEVVSYSPGWGLATGSTFWESTPGTDPLSKAVEKMTEEGEGLRYDPDTHFGSLLGGRLPLSQAMKEEFQLLTHSASLPGAEGLTTREGLNQLVQSENFLLLAPGGFGFNEGSTQSDMIASYINDRREAAQEVLLSRHPDLNREYLRLKIGGKLAGSQEGRTQIPELLQTLQSPVR